MAENTPDNLHLPRRRRAYDGCKHICRLLFPLVRNRVVAYFLISSVVAFGFDTVNRQQHDKLQRHIYLNCVSENETKRQFNTRLKLVDSKVAPMPLADCSPLLRGK